MSMLRKFKKNTKKHVEYICPNCKTKELIPLDIVKNFDLLDSYGVDNSYPPRFQCLNCGDNMVTIYYKSIHGIIHEYKNI